MKKKLLVGLVLAILLVVGLGSPLLAISTAYDTAIVGGVQYLPGDTYWVNTYTEIEYLGDGSFGATITTGHRVFFDKADGNKPKKHKLTDERPAKDYILIQSAKCAVEIYPYYATYFDVQHEEVRVYEERWIVQRLFKEPDEWRDVGAWNPQIVVEEYSHPAGDVVKVTITYTTSYGTLIVEYFQRDGNNLKHNVTFKNTSGSTETFRVIQRWAGIVGDKVEHRDADGQVVTSTITSMEVIDSPAFRFLKDDGSLSVFENQSAMFFDSQGRKLLTQNIKPVEVDVHAQGMKADFVFGSWLLSHWQSLEIDPDTATLDDPTEDGYVVQTTGNKMSASTIIYFGVNRDLSAQYICRGYVEWDVSGIDDGSNVTDTVFKYEGKVHNANATNSDIKAIVNNQPSTHPPGNGAGEAIEVYTEIGTSAAYVSNNATFPVVAANQAQDLGADADTGLENQLASDWFAIGFKTQETETPGQEQYFSHEIYAEEYAATPDPTLYVVYSTVSLPTVTTQAATNIEDTTATGNGNITATGGENCDWRGIVYDLASQGAPGNVHPSASGYSDNQSSSGDFGIGAFTESLTGLLTGRTYYARAWAHNSAGYSYGVEINFLTKPAAPTNVSATDGDHTDKVVITWTKSTGATGYKVYEGINLLDTLGDVATFDDLTAPAGIITPGNASATDGTETAHVVLSVAGESVADGASRTYKVVAFNATGDSDDSLTDTGYRGTGAITYQWLRSAGDADAGYGNIGGATTDPYNDVVAPAGIISNAGTASASDGTSGTHVTLSLGSEATTDGAGRWYYCEVSATGTTTQDSTHNRGYRGVGAITYQWQRSAADSDAAYGDIGGGTTDPYNDTGAPEFPEGRWYRCIVSSTGASNSPQTSTADRGWRAIGPPTVTTQAATNIEDTTATGNGNITATGGENCDWRGIVYDLASQGAPGNVHPSASGYSDNQSLSGSFGTGAFTESLTGLLTGRTYYGRAWAHNSTGYSYGAEINFLTKPAAPTNVSATDGVHTDKVVITWTKSTGATDYHVWRGAVDLGAAGDVATFDDVGADAGTITPGTASASDGTVEAHVPLSLAGESTTDGTAHTYKVVASNATGDSDDSLTDTGYRGVGAITYQWQRSAADSDAAYGNIGGATTDPYNDAGAPANGDGRWYLCLVDAAGAVQAESTHDRGFRGSRHLVIYIDEIEQDATQLLSGGVPGNANNWVFLQNNVMPYADNISISVNSTQQLYFAPNAIIVGTNLPDRGGDATSNNGTISWGANPTGVTITVGSLTPLDSYGAGEEALVSPDVVPEISSPDLNPSGTTAKQGWQMFAPFMTAISAMTNTPLEWSWEWLNGLITLILIVLMFKVTNSVWMAGLGGLVGIGIGLGMDVFAGWMLIVAVIIVIGVALLDRTTSL